MLPERVRDPLELAALLAATLPDELHDGTFNPVDWLTDPRNIALRIGDDLGMFEHMGPGVYLAHVWFVSRGREALTRAHIMLADMAFSYGASRILGETPLAKPHAWLFARMLGFDKTGYAERPQGWVITSTLACGNSHTAAPVLESAIIAR